MTARSELVATLRRRGVDDAEVLAAIGRVPRELFLPPGLGHRAYENEALAIGHGATISQPLMVATIAALLELQAGERVLDVGTGSGYQAAVLAELGAEVITIERVPELAESAGAALAAAGYDTVEVRVGDGGLGVPERAPFDAIAVAAAAPAPPPDLYEQLATSGRLVVPVGDPLGQHLELVVRGPSGPQRTCSVACRFVPLVGSGGFDQAVEWDTSGR